MFKTVGSKENHETSRKHKDNLDKLIEEMNEEEANSDDDDRLEGSGLEEVASSKYISSENDVHEDEVSQVKIPLPSEPQSKSKSKKQKKKQKKKLLDIVDGSCSEPEVVNEFLKPVDGSSDDESNQKRKGKNKKKKSKKEKSQSPDDANLNILVHDKENLNENIIPNSETNKEEIVAQESEIVDKVQVIIPEEEVTIIKASVEDNDIKESRSKKSKHKEKENIENPAKVDLLCAQCRATFPSKNKLFNHLKTSGHAVHIPSDSKPALTSKSKKKNKK